MNQRALIAEFIGTFTLVFIGVGSIAANHITGGGVGLVGIALAHGLSLVVMITAVAAISGGHLNPAVTVGLWAAKKVDLKTAIQYVIVQCIGGIVAAALLKLSLPADVLSAVNLGTPALGANIQPGMGFMMETILTFFLVFAVYGTAVDKHAPKMGGLFIGLTVTFDILMGGPITGAAMNPARHLGPALVSGNLAYIWLYWLGPLLGGILAGLLWSRTLEK